jgi:hypothetical protein
LPLPQRDEVLHRLALARVELEAVPQHLLGRFVLVGGLERAGALVQRGRLVGDRGAGHLGHARERGRPLREREPDVSHSLVDAPEVDVRGHEIGVQRDGPLEALSRGV